MATKPMPKNRKQMFLRHVFSWEMMSLSLLTTLFSFPLFALWSISSVAEASILQQAAQNTEALAQLFAQQLQTCLLSLPFCCLFAVGLGGAFRYLRKLVWREIAQLKQHFFEGVKRGFLQGLVCGVLLWLVVCFVVATSWMIVIYCTDVVAMALLFVALAALLVVFLSAIVFNLAQNAVYQTTFLQRMRNSLYFAVTKFFANLPMVAATLLPFVLLVFLPYTTAVIAIATIYFIYGFGVVLLMQTLYCHSVFDKYINQKQYPQLVKKGLEGTNESDN